MARWLLSQVKLVLVQLAVVRDLPSVAGPLAGRRWEPGALAPDGSAGAGPGADDRAPALPLQSGVAEPPLAGALAGGAYLVIKRLLDITGAFALLLVGLPGILVIALAIKLDSPGPVFYRSRRVGRGGRPISVLKFRSMHTNSDQVLADLRRSEEHREEFETRFKMRHDPRRTRVGRFLRRTSLDEIPQFWNVIRGEMALVGPRPIVEEELGFYRRVPGGEEAYLAVRPGVTGLWQVGGRSDTTYDTRVLMDIRYVREMGMLTDLRILLNTPLAVVRGSGAY